MSTDSLTIPFDAYDLENGNYRLIWSLTCPFAQRTAILRKLLGLESVISEGQTNPVITDGGYVFGDTEADLEPVLGVASMKDLYLQSDADYEGAYTIPVLTDADTGKIVNHQSGGIINVMNEVFKDAHAEDAPNLFPEGMEEQLKEWEDYISENVLRRMYRMGFTSKQTTYDENFDLFFDTLDELEAHLGENEYLNGDQLTISDVLLYTPLVRFDQVYYFLYQINRFSLRDYPNLWKYMRKLYQRPAFKATTDFEAIRRGYYQGRDARKMLSREITPKGPDNSAWEN